MGSRSDLHDVSGRGLISIVLLVLVSLAFIACAQFQHRAPEILPFAARTQTQADGDVRVTVGVPSAEESRQIFGLPLYSKEIQPLWLEIQNNDTTGYFLLAINLDPDLFSAGEVAWKFHTGYSDDAKQKINALFSEKEMKSYFEPGTTSAGFLTASRSQRKNSVNGLLTHADQR